jgi:hypothetical protein
VSITYQDADQHTRDSPEQGFLVATKREEGQSQQHNERQQLDEARESIDVYVRVPILVFFLVLLPPTLPAAALQNSPHTHPTQKWHRTTGSPVEVHAALARPAIHAYKAVPREEHLKQVLWRHVLAVVHVGVAVPTSSLCGLRCSRAIFVTVRIVILSLLAVTQRGEGGRYLWREATHAQPAHTGDQNKQPNPRHPCNVLLNASSAEGAAFLSGWNFNASCGTNGDTLPANWQLNNTEKPHAPTFRYAFLMSASLAVFSTPRTS